MKKRFLYGSIFTVFLIFFSMYLWLSARAANMFYSHALTVCSSQINNAVRYLAKDFAALLAEGDTAGVTCFAAADGSLFAVDGKELQREIDPAVLKSAAADFAVLRLSLPVFAEEKIALAVPVPRQPNRFALRAYGIGEFLDLTTQNLFFAPDSQLLFDELTVPLGPETGGNEKAASRRALLTGADAYVLEPGRAAIQRAGFRKNLVFVPLDQPEGWFWGAVVDYSHESFFMSGLAAPAAIVFTLLVLIICVVIILDIINDRKKKKMLAYVSITDQLTGLTNNAGLQDAVTRFLTRTDISTYSFVYSDVVAFSRINNMFGPTAGDLLLRSLAGVIRTDFECGTRVMADRFVFFAKTTENLAAEIENRFYQALERDMGIEYKQMIAFKFGIFPLQQAKYSFRQIYDGALLALKNAKKLHKQSEVVYDAELKKAMELRKNIEMNMLHALSKQEFIIHIQPQFNTLTEYCCGGETLIRWQSEVMGLVRPDDFIPLFEKNGFIIETDFFMLTSALDLLQRVVEQGQKPLTIAVNQSKVTISFPNYFERLKSIVSQYRLPLEYIELEITESTLENDLDIIIPLLYSLKELGFTIAMDDFGSGFSSLNTLRVMPIDVLKIDKEFLRESSTSEKSRRIIANIINMAKELGIKVICEGVETVTQLGFLKNAGCDIIQGYYFSKPVPLEIFAETYLTLPSASVR